MNYYVRLTAILLSLIQTSILAMEPENPKVAKPNNKSVAELPLLKQLPLHIIETQLVRTMLEAKTKEELIAMVASFWDKAPTLRSQLTGIELIPADFIQNHLVPKLIEASTSFVHYVDALVRLNGVCHMTQAWLKLPNIQKLLKEKIKQELQKRPLPYNDFTNITKALSRISSLNFLNRDPEIESLCAQKRIFYTSVPAILRATGKVLPAEVPDIMGNPMRCTDTLPGLKTDDLTYEEAIRCLLELGANPTSEKVGLYPLNGAIMDDNATLVALMIPYADINHRQKKTGARPQDTTPLMTAAQHSTSAIVQLLLDNGADVHLVDCKGTTALAHARARPNKDSAIEKLLIAHGAK